jgi:hypothetical protein
MALVGIQTCRVYMYCIYSIYIHLYTVYIHFYIGAHPEIFIGGGGADPEAIYNFISKTVIKIM